MTELKTMTSAEFHRSLVEAFVVSSIPLEKISPGFIFKKWMETHTGHVLHIPSIQISYTS